jgi:hypothetical protein
MPLTYTLISSNVLGSAAASVTFSSIPATYTDLVLRLSVRSDRAFSLDAITFTLNTSTANLSNTRVEGTGSAPGSLRNTTNLTLNRTSAATTTADTFTSIEFYIPNYTVSQNKPFSGHFASENNATTAYQGATAGLWSNTASLTSIQMGLVDGPNFVSGSSFYLYGIKNS